MSLRANGVVLKKRRRRLHKQLIGNALKTIPKMPSYGFGKSMFCLIGTKSFENLERGNFGGAAWLQVREPRYGNERSETSLP